MLPARLLISVLPATGVLLLAVIGCSHPQEIDLPSNYTGKVTVLCDRVAEIDQPIQIATDGTARKAACPRTREALTIVRDGKPIQPASEPNWSTTGDGIVLAISFDVR